jgi:hypothetical protein
LVFDLFDCFERRDDGFFYPPLMRRLFNLEGLAAEIILEADVDLKTLKSTGFA